MTHDELLAEIENHQNDYSPQATDITAWDALRAVVELAKPKETFGTAFYDGYNEAMSVIIQAIKKELG